MSTSATRPTPEVGGRPTLNLHRRCAGECGGRIAPTAGPRYTRLLRELNPCGWP